MKGDRGFALVLTLLVTALLVALTVEFTTEVFVDTSARHAFVAGQQASLLAEAGITGGIRVLQFSLANRSYSALTDTWAQPLALSDERGELKVTVEEESGKLNLNFVAPPNGVLEGSFAAGIATRLFRSLGLQQDLIDALADWVDTNDVPHPGGAEAPYYSAQKPPCTVKNGRLDTIEELAMVKGFAGEPLQKLRSLVTVYPDQPFDIAGVVNINTAPKEIIAALDEQIGDELAERVVQQRRFAPFKNAAELAKVPGFETIATRLMTNISSKGNVFRLRAEGRVEEVSRVIEAVVRLGTGSPAILYWREY